MKLLNQHMDSTAIGGSLILLASTIIYLWYKNKKRINYVEVTKVKKLVIYPIKSLGGVDVDQLEVTDNVLKYGNYLDR
jgi:hypothetical protein